MLNSLALPARNSQICWPRASYNTQQAHTGIVLHCFVKNITLSAEETIIEAARQTARKRKTTLNAEFREWLRRYAVPEEGEEHARRYRRLMQLLVGVSSGRVFSRDEMNER